MIPHWEIEIQKGLRNNLKVVKALVVYTYWQVWVIEPRITSADLKEHSTLLIIQVLVPYSECFSLSLSSRKTTLRRALNLQSNTLHVVAQVTWIRKIDQVFVILSGSIQFSRWVKILFMIYYMMKILACWSSWRIKFSWLPLVNVRFEFFFFL